jgi:hypothetical protein
MGSDTRLVMRRILAAVVVVVAALYYKTKTQSDKGREELYLWGA